VAWTLTRFHSRYGLSSTPMHSKIEVSMLGVPESWSNTGVWSRHAAIAQSKRMSEWRWKVIDRGQLRRVEACWEMAELGHLPRRVSIHQMRHGILDDDNLFSSVKPILDGLKTNIRSKGKTVNGAAIIWNDNPRHCKLHVTQERIPNKIYTRTIIVVERFDLEDIGDGTS
jgi:hypothetical protein